MTIILSIAELANYILFSILAGYIALQFVPQANKPTIKIVKSVLLLSTLGIFVFSLAPVIRTISFFHEDIGLPLAIQSVIMDFQVGKAWLFIGFVSTFLWMTIYVEGSKFLQALWLLLMVLAVGYASHSASLSFLSGLISHSIHYLIVILWVGILLNVSWFSKGEYNWSKFLRWFTPFAIACFIIIIITGITLMLFVVEPKNYVKSWVIPYGQMLLLKHISIIPVLAFAFINGVLVKKSLSASNFNPRPWLIGESIILLVVFYFTSILGMSSPPHEIEFALKSEGPSVWVEWLLAVNIVTSETIRFSPTFQSILFLVMSIVFLSLIFISFKKIRSTFAVIFGCCFVIAFYMGLMMALSF